ncbi:MAG: LysE family translocator [Cyanobacteria bacterium P01_D01_bin.50]
MFEINHFPLFIATSILLNLIPGPDSIYIVTKSIAQGRTAGLLSSWGICTGAFVHTVAAAIGLSAIIASSVYAFNTLKYVSAIYLISLGIKSLLDKTNPLEIPQTNDTAEEKMTLSNSWNIFGQGVLIDILNPKVAIFFLAFLPQFINPDSEAKAATFILLGSILIAIALIWEFLLVMFSTLITKHLRNNIAFGTKLNQLSGIILIGLAVIMATQSLHN